jgi:hypothetical protein
MLLRSDRLDTGVPLFLREVAVSKSQELDDAT